jgi:hypothetical protein
MVQRKMDNRPLSLSDSPCQPLLYELRLATRHLSELTRCG